MPKKKKRRKDKGEEKEELPLPNQEEGTMLGVIEQFLGYDRARVLCEDGKVRLCRIPGKMKKRVWMRIGDIVLVAPWEFQYDTKGDIIYRYIGSQVQKLDKMGLLEKLKELVETE
ncbi:MAG: translation initiation factor IF-1A [Thermoproteales archaeon]|nr:translation initiation factor IF-1A [Thermoproteales archaeon]